MSGWKRIVSGLRARWRRADDSGVPPLTGLAQAVRGRPLLPLLRHQMVGKPRAAIARMRRDGWVVRGRSFPVDPPIDWGADPFGDRNWCFRLNALYFVVPFLQEHERTGDPAALAYARRVVLDWITFNLVEDRPNPFRWNDFATGMRAAHLAYLLDRSLREDDAPPQELEPLLRAAEEHMRHLRDPVALAQNNHAYFQLVGLAGLTRALPELPGAGDARAYAAREFERLVERQFTTDAIHTENSPFYHAYALQTIGAVTETGWLEVPPAAAERLERAWAIVPWLVRPDGVFAAIGDSHGGPSMAQQRHLRARGLTPSRGHHAFATGGYAIVRAEGPDGPASDGYVFLTAAYHSHAHKHRDALSFEWIDRGAPRLIDAGVYGMNRDARRDYVMSTRAHNTVEIDGGDVDGGPPRAPTLLVTAQARSLYGVVAEVEHPELALRHRRILLYHPGAWLLVHDEVEADRDRACTAWFHPAAGASAVAIHDLTGEAEISRVCGAVEPRLHGWRTGSYGELVPSEAVGLTRTGRRVTLTTLCVLDDEGGPPPTRAASSDAGEIDLTWRRGEETHGALVSLRGGELSLRPLR